GIPAECKGGKGGRSLAWVAHLAIGGWRTLPPLPRPRLPHSSRFSTSGHYRPQSSCFLRHHQRLGRQTNVRKPSADALIPSSVVPTLRKSRRVGQPRLAMMPAIEKHKV